MQYIKTCLQETRCERMSSEQEPVEGSCKAGSILLLFIIIIIIIT
jgi:hypothetical protein